MLSLTISGAKARALRERRGLSVVDLADAVGCSRWQIYKIEKGTNQPSPTLYKGLKAALRATDDELTSDCSGGAA
ncbi:helix-turn-helix transcriptional regulator [Streptomyces sp. NPDC056987]|uniref:helix-turn-helix transcriptional regulator n=1 Tax=Streptomyces sp. NPDC056987 TaxID=3345988 RepID=UPI003632E07E